MLLSASMKVVGYLMFGVCALSSLGQPSLHLVGQVQSGIENGGSSVTEYLFVNNRLHVEQMLLQLDGMPFQENIGATDKLGDFFFITYPQQEKTLVSVYNWRKGILYDPVLTDPRGHGSSDNAHGYSRVGQSTICSTWPISVEPSVYDFGIKQWVGGTSTLTSVCANAGLPPDVFHDQWQQSQYPLWPGDVGNNFDTAFLLHRNQDIAIPAESGAPSIQIAHVPKELVAKDIRKVLDVSAASSQYLVLSASPGPYQLDTYVLDRNKNQWRFIEDSVGLSYRLFESLLVTSSKNYAADENDPLMRQTCVRTVRDIRDLASNQVYPLPGSRDSEVIDIEPDRTMLFREGTTLYKTKLGSTLNRTKDVLVRGDAVENIHWAFYR